MLAQHIAALNALIDLEEEASDPDGTLRGLYAALQMAQEALQQAAGASERMEVAVSTSLTAEPVLSGHYEGREGVFEGFSAVLVTVMDLWDAGEPRIWIVLERNAK